MGHHIGYVSDPDGGHDPGRELNELEQPSDSAEGLSTKEVSPEELRS